MGSKARQQRQTTTSFSVTDILGITESRDTSTDVTADSEMTSPTHNAMMNKVCGAGGGSLRWLQVLQQHPTRE